MNKKEKKRERENTIEWFFLDLMNHKIHQIDHTNHSKHSNLNFLLMLMNYKNLLKLFGHLNPIHLLNENKFSSEWKRKKEKKKERKK